MLKVKRVLHPGKAHVVHGSEGIKIQFDADGNAEVTEVVATILDKIPGYEIEWPEPPAPKEETAEEDEDSIEDLEEFKNLSWQKQKDYVNKDRVSDEILSDILANGEDYTPTVVKSAEKKVK